MYMKIFCLFAMVAVVDSYNAGASNRIEAGFAAIKDDTQQANIGLQVISWNTDIDGPLLSATNFSVAAGVTFTVTGSKPFEISAEIVTIAGIIDVSGESGHNAADETVAAGGGAGGGAVKISALVSILVSGQILANGGNGGNGGGERHNSFGTNTWAGSSGDGTGGVGVAGGGNGGNGAGQGQNGFDGVGLGASVGGVFAQSVPPGPGGAGHACTGMEGFLSSASVDMTGGNSYGNLNMATWPVNVAGSGGGGGGNDNDNEEGAGGGGSGGSIWLTSPSVTLTSTAVISAVGGLGGLDDYIYHGQVDPRCCYNGGEGSVGYVLIDTHSLSAAGPTFPDCSSGTCECPSYARQDAIPCTTSSCCFERYPIEDSSGTLAGTVNGAPVPFSVDKTLTIDQGDALHLDYTHQYSYDGYCPGCMTQFYFGVSDSGPALDCLGNYNHGSSSGAYSFDFDHVFTGQTGCFVMYYTRSFEYYCHQYYSYDVDSLDMYAVGVLFVGADAQQPTSPHTPTHQPTSPPTQQTTCSCSGCPVFTTHVCAAGTDYCQAEGGQATPACTAGDTDFVCFISDDDVCDDGSSCSQACSAFGCSGSGYECGPVNSTSPPTHQPTSPHTPTHQPTRPINSTSFPEFALTSQHYTDTADHAAACRSAFGPSAMVADWTEHLIPLVGASGTGELCDELGIPVTANQRLYFVNQNGASFASASSTRRYFFERHNGSPPGNWLVHDVLGDITLGSWFSISGPVLCDVSSDGPLTELFVLKGTTPLVGISASSFLSSSANSGAFINATVDALVFADEEDVSIVSVKDISTETIPSRRLVHTGNRVNVEWALGIEVSTTDDYVVVDDMVQSFQNSFTQAVASGAFTASLVVYSPSLSEVVAAEGTSFVLISPEPDDSSDSGDIYSNYAVIIAIVAILLFVAVVFWIYFRSKDAPGNNQIELVATEVCEEEARGLDDDFEEVRLDDDDVAKDVKYKNIPVAVPVGDAHLNGYVPIHAVSTAQQDQVYAVQPTNEMEI